MRIDGKEVPVENMLFTAEELRCLEQAKDKPIVYGFIFLLTDCPFLKIIDIRA